MRMLTTFFIILLLSKTAAGDEPAARVVTLLPSMTEMVYALGAGKSVVGADTYSDFPTQVSSVVKIGNHNGFSIETIAVLKPTEIISVINYFPNEIIDQLRPLGIRITECSNSTLADIETCARLLGRILHREADGERVANEIHSAALQAVTRRANKPIRHVLVLADVDPFYGVGPKTFIHDMITTIGASNVLSAAVQPYIILSRESIITTKANTIVVFSQAAAARTAELFRRAKGKVPEILIFEESLFTRPGPRVILALDKLSRALYPGH